MQNCYGISALEHEFNCSEGSLFLIYAPNGVMKTSFANVFADIASGNQPRDRIFPHRESRCEVTIDGNGKLEAGRVLVVRPHEEKYRSDRTGSLMVNEPLRIEYERLVSELEGASDDLLRGLSEASGIALRSIAKTLAEDEGSGSGDMTAALSHLAEEVTHGEDPGLAGVPYSTVFNPQVLTFLKDPKVRKQLEEYIERYDELLQRSRFFRSGGFNIDGATAVRRTLSASHFFEADHSLLLSDRDANGTPVHSAEELDVLVAAEKRAILQDEGLIARFSAIDEAMSKNVQLRQLRSYLEVNRYVVPELLDPDLLRRRLWLSYGHGVLDRVEAFLAVHRRVRPEVKRLVAVAREQETEWRRVVDIFHERFKVPFVMRVENQDEVILQQKVPTLRFDYDDGREVCEVDDVALMKALSTGELRALYLLNVIFEITSREKDQDTAVLVVDDVADSFDYKNKYAIVEYLMSIRDTHRFTMFVLTHNFDFFRTVRSRLGVSRGGNCLMAIRGDEGIALEPAQNLNPFDVWRSHLDNDRYLVAAIPMIRNLIEYANGKTDDYLLLTALLHQKSETATITRDSISKVFGCVLRNPPTGGAETVLEIIYGEAEDCCREASDSINLANKVVLSIAIRLRAEAFMVSQIAGYAEMNQIEANQTRALYTLWVSGGGREPRIVRIIERVLLMTPEAIHLNSFMYEPILDMSVTELVELYQNVRALGPA